MTNLRSIECAQSWAAEDIANLHAEVDRALASADRVVLFTVARGHDDDGDYHVRVHEFSIRRNPCRVSWTEFLGALQTQVFAWFSESIGR